MKVGDIVKLHSSERKNGRLAGKVGQIIALDPWENPTVNVGGEWKTFHYTQIEKVINERG